MKPLLRWLALAGLALLALQLFFLARIALMLWLDPQSTAFQRSQAWVLNVPQVGTAAAPTRVGCVLIAASAEYSTRLGFNKTFLPFTPRLNSFRPS